jgi:dihydrofolate reductase
MNDGGISYDYDIAWKNKYFHNIITNCENFDKVNAVIMGGRTWEAIRTPIEDVINIVVIPDYFCHNYYDSKDNVIYLTSIIGALSFCNTHKMISNIYIIGDADTFSKFLGTTMYAKLIDRLYLNVLYYNPKYYIDTNIYFPINKLYKYFDIRKDDQNKNNKIFATFICTPKYLKNVSHMS